jgi:hypothetical protein
LASLNFGVHLTDSLVHAHAGEEMHAEGTAGAVRRLDSAAGVELLGEEDMKTLGRICKEKGLHELFMTQMH